MEFPFRSIHSITIPDNYNGGGSDYFPVFNRTSLGSNDNELSSSITSLKPNTRYVLKTVVFDLNNLSAQKNHGAIIELKGSGFSQIGTLRTEIAHDNVNKVDPVSGVNTTQNPQLFAAG